MNTFDNGFQLAFLFRDGSIGFEYDKHQMPAIRSISVGKQKKQTSENKQFIAKLDTKIIRVSIPLSILYLVRENVILNAFNFTLQEMIQKYKIKKPLLNIDREMYDDLDTSH